MADQPKEPLVIAHTQLEAYLTPGWFHMSFDMKGDFDDVIAFLKRAHIVDESYEPDEETREAVLNAFASTGSSEQPTEVGGS